MLWSITYNPQSKLVCIQMVQVWTKTAVKHGGWSVIVWTAISWEPLDLMTALYDGIGIWGHFIWPGASCVSLFSQNVMFIRMVISPNFWELLVNLESTVQNLKDIFTSFILERAGTSRKCQTSNVNGQKQLHGEHKMFREIFHWLNHTL